MSIIYNKTLNGIPYIKTGTGAGTLLVFLGGPGNDLPDRFIVSFYILTLRSFFKKYTVYLMTRRSDLPAGYTVKDLAEDYAVYIKSTFDRPVDIIGISYGGMAVQMLAAFHPELVNKVVIAMSGTKVSDSAITFDERYTSLVCLNRWGRAYALLASAMFSGFFLKKIFSFFMGTYGFFILNKKNRLIKEDLYIEFEAERNFSSSAVLKNIICPVLVICGGKDPFFTPDSVNELKKNIRDSRLIIYNNSAHGIVFKKRFAKDVKEFLDSTVYSQPGSI